jgi:hypothetical protein
MGRGKAYNDRLPIIIPRLDDPQSASADERDEHLMLLEAARHELDVQWTETLAASDSAEDHHLLGYPSTVAYLKDSFRMAGGRAHRYVKRARAAVAFQTTFAAWKHRQISSDETELMFRAAERNPDRYPDAETGLVELVGDGYEDTKKILEYWSHRVDPEGVALDLENQLARRHFDVTRKTNGMVAGSFELPRAAGESLLTGLDALMPPLADNDSRTTSQRRADALEDLARSFLDGSETPTVGGEKPQVVVHVDLPALNGGAGGLHETENGVVLDVHMLRTLACDASVSRVVFGPDREVLDVGRKTRVIPAALRRAVIARDRHCSWPGCGRSPRWCDVHHIISWADGGETVITNLCLLCRYHHTLTHLEITPEDEQPGRARADAVRRRST